jgi:hypothetical protein
MKAGTQHGAFTTTDALACGWTPYWINRARKDKTWTSLHRGVWVETAWYAQLKDPRLRHLCQLHARLLAQDGTWWAARESAALVHGLPLLGAPPAEPLLVAPLHETLARARNRSEQLSPLPTDDRAVVDGINVTSVARTVVDVARRTSFASALMCCEAALHRGQSMSELLAVAHRLATWPGGRGALQLLAFADALSESALESLSRAAFRLCQVPQPEQQVEIWADGRLVARVDFLWREANLVGEADGAQKYAKTDQLDRPQDAVQVLLAEKEREGRIRDLGLDVVRWGWDDALRPQPLLANRVRAGLERGARLQLRPGVELRSTARPAA